MPVWVSQRRATSRRPGCAPTSAPSRRPSLREVKRAIGPEGRSLAVLPFSHLFGLVVSGLAPLISGGRVTTMDRFNPIKALELIRSHRTTQVVGVPSVFHGLLAALERGGATLASGGQAWVYVHTPR